MSNTLENTLPNTTNSQNSNQNRIDYLDGWRGLAILLVLLEHFFDIHLINIGRMGVDAFFVLSGMLMSNILFVQKVSLKKFYKRRVSRILPIFFIFITAVSLLSFALNLSSEHKNYFYNLFFLRAYYPETPDLWHTGLPIGHLWSLNVEEHSYILLSLIALSSLLFKRIYLPILTLGIASILLQYLYIRFPEIAPPNYQLRTEIVASFLMISAGYFLIKHKFEKFIPPWAPILSLVLAFFCYTPNPIHWTAKWSIAPFLLAFTVNHLNLTPALFKKLFCFSPLRLIGIWSFSIYLWQHPLYYYGTQWRADFAFAGTLQFIAAVFIGLFSFYFIENPARKYLNSRW